MVATRSKSAAKVAQLDIHARCASPASQCGKNEAFAAQDVGDRLIRRFALQSAAKELLKRERVGTCLRVRIPTRATVDVLYSAVSNSASYSGLQVCGSVWHCPVCAAKISEKRRVELSAGLRAWAGEGLPGCVVFATFTLRHHAGENLEDVLKTLKKARRLLTSGKAAQAFNEQYQVAGHIRALEVTYGENGWHPHLHVLMFLESRPGASLDADLAARWLKAVSAAGGSATTSGFHLEMASDRIADYIAKFGREPKWTAAHETAKAVSKQSQKGGRTPLQLLADFFDGDKLAGRLWLQYAVNFKGERQLHWSHGLRARLGLDAEQTDEELAAAHDEVAVLLAQLRSDQWRVILANDCRGELLAVASSGNADKLAAWLEVLGVW